jgi:multiple sugar transport system substrate-binding protein
MVRRYSQGWASRSGARVEVLDYDPTQPPAAPPPADVWVIPTAEMPRWAAAKAIRPIPAEYVSGRAGYDWQNLLPTYRDRQLVWDGTPYAFPLLPQELLCFYREDLLQEAANRDAFRAAHRRELAPPKTWQEFADSAEFFNGKSRPGIDPPCASLPPLPEAEAALDREFYTVAAPFAHVATRQDDAKLRQKGKFDPEVFSFQYDVETGAAQIASPGFVAALRLCQRLQQCRPKETAREPAQSFAEGKAVLCLAEPRWIHRFQAPNSKARDRFGICPVPGSSQLYDYHTGQVQAAPGGNQVPYLGASGWVAVVPAGAAQPEAAFALLAHLTGPETSRDLVIEPAWGGGAFRREHLEAQMGWQAFGLSTEHTRMLEASLRDTLKHLHLVNPVLRLRTPDQHAYQQAVVAELRAALVEGKDAASALKAAAQRWQELDAAKAPKQHLAEYRLSIGLEPQP